MSQKYNELSKEELARYKSKADQLYFEKYGVHPSTPEKKAKPKIIQKLKLNLVKKKAIEDAYPEPKTPFDLWSNKKMLKDSTMNLSELKAEWKCLDMKEKVKYILKAMKLAKDSDKSAVTKEEKKILDEYEERPKYPPTAFGEFWAEHKNKTMIQVAELWKNLPEHEKNKRKEKFRTNLREYKSNMQEFLDSLSEERLELEQMKKKPLKKANPSRESPKKKSVKDKSKEKSKPLAKSEEKIEKKKKTKEKAQEMEASPKKKVSKKTEDLQASPEPEKKKRKSQKKEATPEPSPAISKKESRKRKRARNSDTELDSDDQFEKSEVPKSYSKKRKIKEVPEDAEMSVTPQTPVNGQAESPTKKKKKKEKVQKMAPPEQPVR